MAALAIAEGYGQTRDPVLKKAQLFLALQVYALAPEAAESMILHPDVERSLQSLIPTIDATRSGETSDCGAAALELALAIEAFRG